MADRLTEVYGQLDEAKEKLQEVSEAVRCTEQHCAALDWGSRKGTVQQGSAACCAAPCLLPGPSRRSAVTERQYNCRGC